jgi:hypothetical protein
MRLPDQMQPLGREAGFSSAWIVSGVECDWTLCQSLLKSGLSLLIFLQTSASARERSGVRVSSHLPFLIRFLQQVPRKHLGNGLGPDLSARLVTCFLVSTYFNTPVVPRLPSRSPRRRLHFRRSGELSRRCPLSDPLFEFRVQTEGILVRDATQIRFTEC